MRRLRPRLFALLSIFFSLFIVLLIPVSLFLKPYLPFVNYLLGTPKPTSYLVLLGNDTEMRANGGFVGSYAKIILNSPQCTMYNLKCKIFSDLSFQDIYVPNGQLKGYVAPPAPIQQAFQHGTWELANADWEPDFPTAATTLRWFFDKGGEINPDNLVLLNLSTIKKVLDVVGTIDVPEYQATLTPDNLYLFLQGKVEMNFFPGSTQKKDTLTAVGSALMKKFQTLSLIHKFQIAQILYLDLQNQNILVNSANPSFQAFLESKNFAGKLTSVTPDTYLLVETNLGANKANAYITRSTHHQITVANGQVTHQVTVKFANASPQENPNPPFDYSGNYLAYLRFYLPSSAQNISLTTPLVKVYPPVEGGPGEIKNPTNQSFVIPGSDPESIKIIPNISQKYGFTEVGFWNTTRAQNQSQVTLSYTLSLSGPYSLTLLKQHGLVSSPQTIDLNNHTYTTDLTHNFTLP